MSAKTLALIEEHDVKWVDLRFTDTRGKEQHVTVPARDVNEEFFENGQMFDGSSINGWKGINESDMILRPEDGTGFLDPFTEDATLILRCDIIEPATMQPTITPMPLARAARAMASASVRPPALSSFTFTAS